jgi:cell division protein FtsB
MESKIAAMKNGVSTTINQLRENLTSLNQYKVRMQTIAIRIKIEQKVKAMNDAAMFEQRKAALLAEIDKSKASHRQLEAEVKKVKEGWLVYYEEAIENLKLSFKEIDRDTLKAWAEKSERERTELEAEIKLISKEVEQLDHEIDKTTAEASDEDLIRLKRLTEEKLVHFKNLMNKK